LILVFFTELLLAFALEGVSSPSSPSSLTFFLDFLGVHSADLWRMMRWRVEFLGDRKREEVS
jgi:hypothetical protein